MNAVLPFNASYARKWSMMGYPVIAFVTLTGTNLLEVYAPIPIGFLKTLELSRSKASQSNRSLGNESTGKASQNKLLRFVVPWCHCQTQKCLPTRAYESAPYKYTILQLNRSADARSFWLLLVSLIGSVHA